MSIKISSDFDGGNIEVLANNNDGVQHLNIRIDKAADYRQWFYFKVEGGAKQLLKYSLDNACQASYAEAWQGYDVVASYDRQSWFRVPADYIEGALQWQFSAAQDSVYFSYFAPYDQARHDQLIQYISLQAASEQIKKITTVDGYSVELFKITDRSVSAGKKKIWLIARQHPGETMAEWFMQGLLEKLFDSNDSSSQKLLAEAEFYIVVNMNPDGSWAGNLRTNGAGTDLNRAWAEPCASASPEVLGVRDAMDQIGVDLFLDIHGDEELPYIFTAGCEGNPAYTPRLAGLEERFRQRYQQINPDFQSLYGYSKDAPGSADLRIACNQVGQRFDCLAFTIEMPFKDNANNPDPLTGWSPQRSMKLGESSLDLILELLPEL